MRGFLRNFLFPPTDPGVASLAKFLSVEKYQIYEMISQMEIIGSREFIDNLNLYHDDRDYLFGTAKTYVLYMNLGPNCGEKWRKGWNGDYNDLDLTLITSGEDLKVVLKLFPHLERGFGRYAL